MLKTRLNFSQDKGFSVFHCSVSLRWLLLSHLHKYLFKSHPHPVGNLGKWRSDLIFKFEIQNTIVGFIRIFGSIVARFRDLPFARLHHSRLLLLYAHPFCSCITADCVDV